MANGPQPPLSDAQIVAYARRAGFLGNALETMVAVILGESSGDPDVLGDESLANATWGPSVGLAQIRSLKAQYRTGQTRDASRLTDPTFNLRSAFAISSGGTNFAPWSVFTSGRYRSYIARARAAITGTPATPSSPAGPAAGAVLERAAGGGGGGLVDKITQPLLSGLARIALSTIVLAGGVALVAVGGWRAMAPVREKAADVAVDAAKVAATVAA
jgi:Lysozyme like domain